MVMFRAPQRHWPVLMVLGNLYMFLRYGPGDGDVVCCITKAVRTRLMIMILKDRSGARRLWTYIFTGSPL